MRLSKIKSQTSQRSQKTLCQNSKSSHSQSQSSQRSRRSLCKNKLSQSKSQSSQRSQRTLCQNKLSQSQSQSSPRSPRTHCQQVVSEQEPVISEKPKNSKPEQVVSELEPVISEKPKNSKPEQVVSEQEPVISEKPKNSKPEQVVSEQERVISEKPKNSLPEQVVSEPMPVISEKPKNSANRGKSFAEYLLESEDDDEERPAKPIPKSISIKPALQSLVACYYNSSSDEDEEPEHIASQPELVISENPKKSAYSGPCDFDSYSDTEDQEPPAKRSATMGMGTTQKPFLTKCAPFCQELVRAEEEGDLTKLDDSFTSEYLPGAESDSENKMDFNDDVFERSFEADDPPPQETITTRKRKAATKSAPAPKPPCQSPRKRKATTSVASQCVQSALNNFCGKM